MGIEQTLRYLLLGLGIIGSSIKIIEWGSKLVKKYKKMRYYKVTLTNGRKFCVDNVSDGYAEVDELYSLDGELTIIRSAHKEHTTRYPMSQVHQTDKNKVMEQYYYGWLDSESMRDIQSEFGDISKHNKLRASYKHHEPALDLTWLDSI